jgi:hypothetical protein
MPLKFHNNSLRSLALTAVTSLAIATPSFAATSNAHLENAQIYGIGKKIQIVRLPTVNAAGEITYHNVTIGLNILNNGRVDATDVTVNSSPTPASASNKFIPGTYTDGAGNICTVVTNTLPGGRLEAALSCKQDNGAVIQANWVTGLIRAHPFELDLKAASIDKIPYTSYSWGKVANGNNWWGCMHANDIVSARQIGNTLAVGGYDLQNKQMCGVNLTKK